MRRKPRTLADPRGHENGHRGDVQSSVPRRADRRRHVGRLLARTTDHGSAEPPGRSAGRRGRGGKPFRRAEASASPRTGVEGVSTAAPAGSFPSSVRRGAEQPPWPLAVLRWGHAMSSPTSARPSTPAITAIVPRPRTPVEPPVTAAPPRSQEPAPQPGMFDLHGWLIPACAIASVLALFIAMILLTWVAGGGTPFNR
jgi:hypothetical protein